SVRSVASFPFVSYLVVLLDFLNFGGYKVEGQDYISGLSGIINWSRTLKLENSLITPDGPVFPSFQARIRKTSEASLVSEIYQYCVHLSSRHLGWLWGVGVIQKPLQTTDESVYIAYLTDLIARTYRDREKRLFSAMLNILQLMDTP